MLKLLKLSAMLPGSAVTMPPIFPTLASAACCVLLRVLLHYHRPVNSATPAPAPAPAPAPHRPGAGPVAAAATKMKAVVFY